jgi:hypothetical protein
MMGADCKLHAPQLFHERLIYVQTSGRVDEQNVIALGSGLFDGTLAYFNSDANSFTIRGALLGFAVETNPGLSLSLLGNPINTNP